MSPSCVPTAASATPPHRIGRLRWCADVGDGAAAAHLRGRLQAHGERVTQALSSVFDELDPGAGRTLHVRRLLLKLDAAWLELPDEALGEQLATAVRQAWARMQPSAVEPAGAVVAEAAVVVGAHGDLDVLPEAGRAGGPVAAPLGLRDSAVQRSAQDAPADDAPLSAPDASAVLQRYLASGELPPALSAMDAQQRAQALQRSAAQLADTSTLLRLGGRAGDLAQRIDWFRRWLALWPEAERGRWLVRRFDPSPSLDEAGAAEVLEQLERLLPRLAGDPLLQAQAVWLAAVSPGPVSFDPLRRASDTAVKDDAIAQWLARLSPAPPADGPPQAG